jgi:hypothetical protein
MTTRIHAVRRLGPNGAAAADAANAGVGSASIGRAIARVSADGIDRDIHNKRHIAELA